jgi:four helix bundle protein
MLEIGCLTLDAGWIVIKNKDIMSYRNLEIWRLAREVVVDVHRMTLTLPKYEQFEEAQQIRRSSKSVRSTIVEGYGRRYYKADFIRFVIYALASNDETLDHPEILFETGSLTDEQTYHRLHNQIEILGKKLNNFLKAVIESHEKPGYINDPLTTYSSFNENEHL